MQTVTLADGSHVYVLENSLLMPSGWQGYSLGRLIVVRDGDDIHLVTHELSHSHDVAVRGWWRYAWEWMTSPKFRLACEVRAYRAALTTYADLEDRDRMRGSYAQALATKYRGLFGFDVSVANAYTLLS